MRELIHIGDWGIGVAKTPYERVFIEYQGFDQTIHSAHDVRLYINGNFGSIDSQIEYAKVVANMLVKGKE